MKLENSFNNLKMKFRIFVFVFIGTVLFSINLIAQSTSRTINKESNVKNFILPKILLSDNGIKINTIKKWEEIRRNEIIEHFTNKVYGKVPGKIDSIRVDVIEDYSEALKGKAKRKQIKLTFEKNGKKISIVILIYLPNKKIKTPAFLAYNFGGNQKVNLDKNIYISENLKQSEIKRGINKSRWPLNKIIESGYALITLNYNEIDPDKNNFSDGVHSLFYSNGMNKPRSNQWGSISAWAWGLSRIMDYLDNEPLIDKERIVLLGHSRLGKTALWAGALDQRFSIVISNNSGCGGAAISRRRFGEKISDINTNYPHWFAKNFHFYNEKESQLSVDQHMLIALIAPRPIYIASASLDSWADPRGEFLSAKEAKDIYNLYGFKEKNLKSFPNTNSPIHGRIGFHLRKGHHDITEYDWNQYIQFSNMHF